MPDRHGPMRTGRFTVEIDEVEVAGFQRVEIPSQNTEVGEYREGNDPEQEKKLWGQTTLGTLTMERVMQADDTTLHDWSRLIAEGNVDEGRKQVTVSLVDEEGEPQISWEFTGAWPRHYDPPTLDARRDEDDESLATETVVIAFDEMVRERY